MSQVNLDVETDQDFAGRRTQRQTCWFQMTRWCHIIGCDAGTSAIITGWKLVESHYGGFKGTKTISREQSPLRHEKKQERYMKRKKKSNFCTRGQAYKKCNKRNLHFQTNIAEFNFLLTLGFITVRRSKSQRFSAIDGWQVVRYDVPRILQEFNWRHDWTESQHIDSFTGVRCAEGMFRNECEKIWCTSQHFQEETCIRHAITSCYQQSNKPGRLCLFVCLAALSNYV